MERNFKKSEAEWLLGQICSKYKMCNNWNCEFLFDLIDVKLSISCKENAK